MARIVVLGSFADSLVNFRGHLMLEMQRQGHEVIACAPDASDTVRSRLAAQGVDYRAVNMQRTGINALLDIKTIIELVLFFRQNKTDVLFAYTIKPVIYGSIAARLAGVGKIYSMITGIGSALQATGVIRSVVAKIATRLYRTALHYNHGVFFQNPDDREFFCQRGIIENRAICTLIDGSGVDTQHFKPGPLAEEPSFLLIARLVRDKGIIEYVTAARMIKKKYPGIKFRLAGWQDTRADSISLADINAWVDEGIIEFLGKLEDVRPALAECSVYVLPSYREGMPRTVLEAMSMGRPVITTDAPGCRETVVDGHNGWLVPVRDVTNLADRMERFIMAPERIDRMGRAGREMALARYDVHKVNKQILNRLDLWLASDAAASGPGLSNNL